MYEEFYGLNRAPFDLTPNPRFLLLTPTQGFVASTYEEAADLGKWDRKALERASDPRGA